MISDQKRWQTALFHIDYAFQPIVNIHTGVCYGFEALIRNHRKAGFDSIGKIFDEAYGQGLLHQVDMALREKAIAKFSRIPWKGRTKLFFNLDNRLLGSRDYQSGKTLKILERFGFHRDSVCFEISEKHELQNVQETVGTLSKYRSQGFKIAVDDCGTGFSGLQLLYYTEPDFIKIDRFFIQDIPNDPKKKLFVSSIVNIAHLMGSIVVAEGVETKQEFYACRDIGCDLVQGYWVQEPQVEIGRLSSRYDHVSMLGRADQRTKATSDRKLINMEMAYIEPILVDASLLDVFEKFRMKKDATFFPVVNCNGEPLGIIREILLKDYAYSRYGHELLQNPAFGRNINKFISKFPMADIHTPVEKILEIYTLNEHLEGILIVDNMKYVGFLSAQSLLKVLNEKNLAIARDQNPLTRLPGNTLIYEYLSQALHHTAGSYVMAYFDFDNFKPYNDKYGFRHGDRVILLFAELLKQRNRPEGRFYGHIGGDDFFMGVRGSDLIEVKTEVLRIIARFERDVESFYDPASIREGRIESVDREGHVQTFPLLTVSCVILELPAGRERVHTTEEILNLIAAMKKQVKASPDKIVTTVVNRDADWRFPHQDTTGQPLALSQLALHRNPADNDTAADTEQGAFVIPFGKRL